MTSNAAYRHFADRDEILAAVCAAALRELADRMAVGVARVRGKHGDPAAALRRLHAIGTTYLEFGRQEPGLFATAFALPQQHTYEAPDDGTVRALNTPSGPRCMQMPRASAHPAGDRHAQNADGFSRRQRPKTGTCTRGKRPKAEPPRTGLFDQALRHGSSAGRYNRRVGQTLDDHGLWTPDT